ncbi:uncharacterized protein N7458_003767 [Penicillium daleae]|uniref:Uncharacterized protein n=1 Tax=Penicillium daleae TaxID=63821 RepID=A0AAD6C954_9EURO|nr:uncharacterized protein N7458_003767 [Penicillium daleae]KAJ5455503.1 hypothetical protein N7458_003767 [Penicillium daleae]
MEHVLNSPELLLMIFECLEKDKGSLAVGLRVSRTGFTYGIGFLWISPTCDTLAKVRAASRQICAEQVQDLIFQRNDWRYYDDLKNLAFKRLRKVTVNSYGRSNENSLNLQYLQPSWEELAYNGSKLDPVVLKHLQLLCPRLRKISLPASGLKLTSKAVVIFLQNSSLVEHVEFDEPVCDKLFTCLSSRENLRCLKSGRLIHHDSITKVSGLVSTPIRAIENLSIRISSDSMSNLVDMLQSTPLRILRLEVEFADHLHNHPQLTVLSRLVHLQEMELCVCGSVRMIKNEFKPIQQLTNLRSLSIKPDGDYPEIDEFTDMDLDNLLSNLSRLENFQFSFIAEELSMQAAAIISDQCPHIQRCQVGLTWTANILQSTPLFPQIEEFCVAAFLAKRSAIEIHG